MAAEIKIPKTLGACADRLYALKALKSAAQKAVDALAEEESAIKNHLIENLPKSEASGVAGKVARAMIITQNVPQVKDWDAFYEHVRKTKSFDLLQRRVSDAAVKERWENGKKVPGVETFTVVKVSLNKL